ARRTRTPCSTTRGLGRRAASSPSRRGVRPRARATARRTWQRGDWTGGEKRGTPSSRMLARYSIVRGAKAANLPDGERQDTRKHTKHVLRPTPELVEQVLGAHAGERAWAEYPVKYRALLEQRFTADRGPFDHLANVARFHDVYLGCNCPTKKQP